MTSLSHTKPTPLPRLNGTGTTPSPVLRGQEYSSSEAEEDDALMGDCADCEECARNQAAASYDDHTGQRSHRSTGKRLRKLHRPALATLHRYMIVH